jgi:hypothetical protein
LGTDANLPSIVVVNILILIHTGNMLESPANVFTESSEDKSGSRETSTEPASLFDCKRDATACGEEQCYTISGKRGNQYRSWRTIYLIRANEIRGGGGG